MKGLDQHNSAQTNLDFRSVAEKRAAIIASIQSKRLAGGIFTDEERELADELLTEERIDDQPTRRGRY